MIIHYRAPKCNALGGRSRDEIERESLYEAESYGAAVTSVQLLSAVGQSERVKRFAYVCRTLGGILISRFESTDG